jgi:hypothetical protein
MGSGDKFRFGWMPKHMFSFGVAVCHMSEHEWSIHIDLIFWQVYIGVGKGYEEFR